MMENKNVNEMNSIFSVGTVEIVIWLSAKACRVWGMSSEFHVSMECEPEIMVNCYVVVAILFRARAV